MYSQLYQYHGYERMDRKVDDQIAGRKPLEQAIQTDAHTSAVATLPTIRKIVEELWEANKEYAVGW